MVNPLSWRAISATRDPQDILTTSGLWGASHCKPHCLFPLQDSLNPDDSGRRFILSYFLSNDTISIFEKNMRNSGIIGGKFLEKTQVHKPGSIPENPQYYGPADFAIGATVEGIFQFIPWHFRHVTYVCINFV